MNLSEPGSRNKEQFSSGDAEEVIENGNDSVENSEDNRNRNGEK